MAALGLAAKLAALARGAVDKLFVKARMRIGVQTGQEGAKQLEVKVDRRHTLPGLYEAAALVHGVVPRKGHLDEVVRTARGYLDAQRALARTAVGRIVHHVVAGVQEGLTQDKRAELVGALDRFLERLQGAVERIVSTEGTAARNLGGVEAISAQNVAAGRSDPVVFWIVTHDKTCHECYKIHTIDGKIPRLWLMSEVSSTYHVHGEDRPSILGLHPHCQCMLTTLMPGWGFDASGYVKYVGPGHDEFAVQRGGVQKAEDSIEELKAYLDGLVAQPALPPVSPGT